MLIKFLKSFKIWENVQFSSFWFSTISIYFCFTTLFSHPASLPKNHCQTLTVIEQVRCGASEKPYSDRQQDKVTNSLDDLAKREYMKKILIEHFPDLESRVFQEKRQGRIYQKAIKKIKEYKRISPLLNNYQELLTAEEKSAIDYFHGTGIYAKFQDPNTSPNIYDTRKTFLKKMENKEMREKFLEAYNRQYSIE